MNGPARAVLVLATFILSATAATGGRGHAGPELRGEAGLVRAYEFILEARFDQVEAELRRACGPAPPEACDVLDATAVWWRIMLDPESEALDPAFSAAVERAIAAAEAWTERAPDDAEAWFYLGAAYAARVQWRVLREHKLAAARDGKRIKDALEQALSLDPELADAHFGIGMYKYYADVAPAVARFFRFLLLLPGGDREEGLQQMLQAREGGRLLQGEADYQLHLIYLWYEDAPDLALELLRGLHARHPGNPLYLARIAEILDEYKHDITASLDAYDTLLAAARAGRVNVAALAEVTARLGVARQLEALHQTDLAIEHLKAIVAAQPSTPYSSYAVALLRLGEAHDRLGARQAALAAYKLASAAAPADDPFEVRDAVRARQQHAPDSRRARAYRASLEGWRRFERHDLAGASAALERALERAPEDPVARYRYGRVLQARRDDPGALVQFQHAIRGARACPAPILGEAYLEAARLLERSGRVAEAMSGYRIAATLFGAAAPTRAAATRAVQRLDAR
jgi:tetratricopeptide (TPR) repeat protein